MDKLNAVHKAFLTEIAQKKEWQDILEYIKRREVARYKKRGDNEESKTHEWIYESGRSDENDFILTTLTNGELHE